MLTLAAVCALVAQAPRGNASPGPDGRRPRVHVAKNDPVIAAAGNIACDPSNPAFNAGNGSTTACHMKVVSDLLLRPDGVTPRYRTVLALGDTQYTCGGLQAYHQSYGPTWGRVFAVTKPVVGDKDYRTTANAPGATGCQPPPGSADGFFAYFATLKGPEPGPTPGSGAYYSFNVPKGCKPGPNRVCWHVVALNGNCDKAKGCTPGTPQYDWLAADLTSHPDRAYGCTLAFWHWPRFSSGVHGSDATYDAIWRLLYQRRVDVVLNAHEHVYERFARQTPGAIRRPSGIREFIVGTGGASHVKFPSSGRAANSEASSDNTFGILTLSLHRDGYDWRFIPEPGGAFHDASAVPTPCR